MYINSQKILTFIIEQQRFAIHLEAIERVIRAQEITKLTDSPDFIEGVIDYHGEVIAVINLRKRLGYPLQEIKLSDRLIIVKSPNRKLALIVDEVEDIMLPDTNDLFESKEIDSGLKFANIFRDDKGIVFIYDLEKLLSKAEEIELNQIIDTNFSLRDKNEA
jgi:purine-binding chemotaxis protein CheW